MSPEMLAERVRFLRQVPMFAGLPEADLARLAQQARQIELKPGELLFAEGSPGDSAYVVRSGNLEVTKNSGGRELLLNLRQQGQVVGELALLEEAPRMASVRARQAASLLAIHKEHLDAVLDSSPAAGRALLQVVLSYWHNTEALVHKQEKMTQLGTLTAGVAHELNNPAAAARRSAAQLEEAALALEQAYREMNLAGMTPEQEPALQALIDRQAELAAQAATLDAITRSDREADLEAWLEDRDVPDAWESAPLLVDMGYDVDALQEAAGAFSGDQIAAVVRRLAASHRLSALSREIVEATSRISTIVKSLKDYAYLDQAPVQAVNIHEGIDNTLTMLNHRLQSGIVVRRDYLPDLPPIQAYGSELNQVWTAIIGNAIDALGTTGEIVIRTCREGGWAVVEITDNGPGIPPEIQGRVFDAFFTTKPPGQGAGLGLNIAHSIVVTRHLGDIGLTSQPGCTMFQVRLPLDIKAAESGEATLESFPQADDDQLRRILETSRRVAVVGASNRPDRPAYSVPVYLQRQGYEILPVSPNLDEFMGAPAYDDLSRVPGPVDIVLVFRRPEFVPDVARAAIEVGAKTLWMQEGISNFEAAIMARNAGLNVVMNTCMRATHKRLFGSP